MTEMLMHPEELVQRRKSRMLRTTKDSHGPGRTNHGTSVRLICSPHLWGRNAKERPWAWLRKPVEMTLLGTGGDS